MSPPATDTEDFWSDLLPLIAERRVVPIVGSDLLTVSVNGVRVPFYQRVAERLLARYNVDAEATGTVLRPHHELNDAICALARLGKRESADSYIPVHEAIRTTVNECRSELETPMRQLASIEDFRLFVTTTCDDVLAQALNDERYGAEPRTQQVEYAPDALPDDRVTDLGDIGAADTTQPARQGSAVLYLFGKAAALPVFATHDEDVLEFLYGIQAGLGRTPKRFFSEIRGANLLLIGCQFPDWLSRFLVRVASPRRLSDQPRRKDFIIDPLGEEPGFVVFLRTFAHNTRTASMSPASFVAELATRWHELHPPAAAMGGPAVPAVSAVRTRKRVFISYSRTDIEPVRTLYEEIKRVAGDDVAWFDKSEINPGDEWDARIMDGIEQCQLFLPVVSQSEEERTEGVFIKEWKRARARAEEIDGRAFIVPVFVDPDAEANLARYRRASSMFGSLDFGFAPGGRLTPRLEALIKSELRAFRA